MLVSSLRILWPRARRALRRPAPPVADLASVEELLVEFLGRHSIDDATAFEELCRQHADSADRLRELHAQWAMLDRALGARGGDPAQAPAGSSAQPAPSPVPSSVGSGVGEVLARLESHRPVTSRYRIDSELARGGMGVVYRAWDTDLRRVVAMKVLRDERLRAAPGDPSQHERMLARFVEEAQITGQLDHPGIVPVHEIGLDADGRLYFTMPLVRGRELGRLFSLARERREGWSLPRLLAVFVRVCEAVAYAHSKGVVHRDLKPSNVMVGAFGETYVMDWGLARLVEGLRAHSERVETDSRALLDSASGSVLATRHGAVIGTPAYMAPEQAQGRLGEIGPLSDVYAIGAMLYQLLTGSMPYADSTAHLTPQALIAARLSRAPTPIARLAPHSPPELIAICAKAMAERPADRYASALELAEDLEAFLGRRPVRAIDASAWYLVRLALHRNARTALAVAAGLVVAFGLLVRDAVRSRAAANEQERYALSLSAANDRLRLQADEAQAKVLVSSEQGLTLDGPEQVERMREWLASANALLERAVEARVVAASAPSVPTHATSLELYAALSNSIGRVRERLTRVEACLEGDREAWQAAIESIANSERYGGLRLEPQWGLAPLQLNPTSGLWEFWVVESGAPPRIADRSTGRLELDPHSALVLVLIPGGNARLGSASNDLGRNLLFPPRADGADRTDNEDERWLALEPFFLGKCETPQSVWQRVMGWNPSQFSDAEMCKYEPWTGLLPVESVTWRDARAFADKLGLELPTEAQWEYAARCGSFEPLAFGASDDLASLAGLENLNDHLGREQAPANVGLLSQPWCDGYWSIAPIMSLGANAWGLHDLLGNVSEACRDVYSEVPVGGELVGPDGAAPLAEGRHRVFRGASYFTPRAEAVRVAFRQWDRPTGTNHGRGLRVARPIR